MEKRCTMRNTEKKTIPAFLKYAVFVCMLFLTVLRSNAQDLNFGDFNLLLAPSCITNSASTSDIFLCEGTSAQIGFSMGGLVFPNPGGPISWQWQKDSLGSGIDLVDNSLYLNTSGNSLDPQFGRDLFITNVTKSGLQNARYRVVLTFNDGYCNTTITTNYMTITVFEPPTANVTSQPNPVCYGASGTLTVNAAGVDATGFFYTWSTGETTQSITIPNVTEAGNYTVTVQEEILYEGRAEKGCFVVAQGSFNLIFPPTVTINPVDVCIPAQNALGCKNITLTANVTGTPTPTISWYKNDVLLTEGTQADNSVFTGTSSTSLNFCALGPNYNGTYKAVVSNACGDSSATVVLLPCICPTLTITDPSPQTLCAGQDAVFSVITNPVVGVVIQWYKNSLANPIPGANTAVLTLNNITLADAGSYFAVATLAATADCGPAQVTSVDALLIVNELPTVSIDPVDICIPSANVTACKAISLNANVTTGTPAPVISWFKNDVLLTEGVQGDGTIFSGTTTATLSFCALGPNYAGTYKVLVVNECGTAFASVVLSSCVCPDLTITNPSSDTLCVGQDATFSVIANATEPATITYQWYFNNLANPIPGATNPVLNIDNVTLAHIGNYFAVATIAATADCGTVTATSDFASLLVYPDIKLVCFDLVTRTNIGSTIALTPTIIQGVGITYHWSLNGVDIVGETNATFTRIVQNTDNNAQICVTIHSLCGSATCCTTIEACTPPVIVTPPVSTTICKNECATFTVVASGSEPLSYQWFRTCIVKVPGTCWPYKSTTSLTTTPIEGATNDTLTLCDFDKSCKYFVVVSNDCGSDTSSVVNISFEKAPVVCCPGNKSVCVGADVQLKGTLSYGSGEILYQWLFNGNVVANTANFTINDITAETAGVYTFVASNNCGSDTCWVFVKINNPPVITSSPEDATICGYGCETLTVRATGDNLSYQWYKRCPCGDNNHNNHNKCKECDDCKGKKGKNNSNCKQKCIECSGDLITSKIHNANKPYLKICNQTDTLCEYFVVVSNKCGSVNSDTAFVTVIPKVVITKQPVDVCADGNTASFKVKAIGSDLTYQWFMNGIALNNNAVFSGVNTDNLYISNVSGLNGKLFSVKISNECNSVVSCFVKLTVSVPCTVPTGLCVTGVTTNCAKLNWNKANGASGYIVTYWIKNAKYKKEKVVTTSYNSLFLSNLTSGAEYCFHVQAICKNCCTCNSYGYSNKATCKSEESQKFCFETKKCGCYRDLTPDNTNSDYTLKVYPNPSNAVVNISLPADASTLTVTNINGQILINENISADNNSNYQLDMSRFEQGVYFIRVNNNDSNQVVKFFRQ